MKSFIAIRSGNVHAVTVSTTRAVRRSLMAKALLTAGAVDWATVSGPARWRGSVTTSG
ncbi:MAG: hypothetical protein WBN68_11095 [Sedimenticolaceae bacterium]